MRLCLYRLNRLTKAGQEANLFYFSVNVGFGNYIKCAYLHIFCIPFLCLLLFGESSYLQFPSMLMITFGACPEIKQNNFICKG